MTKGLRAGHREYAVVLPVRCVEQLRIEALARSVAEGRSVSWASIVRELVLKATTGDGGAK